jgi:hypothetical protein
VQLLGSQADGGLHWTTEDLLQLGTTQQQLTVCAL